MKISPLSLCIFFILIATSTLSASTMHTIIVADTIDHSIGEGNFSDLVNMSVHFRSVAEITGLDCDMHMLYGKNFAVHNVAIAITDIECDSDDVIVFYYSGHGFRTEETTSHWPTLDFDMWGLDLQDIIDAIKEKGARFSLIMVDCCNVTIPQKYAPRSREEPLPRAQKIDYTSLIKNYCALFCNSKGIVVTASSAPGQSSYCYRNGGWYTNSYLESFAYTVTDTTAPTWEAIFAGADEYLQYRALNYNREENDGTIAQTPLLDISTTPFF